MRCFRLAGTQRRQARPREPLSPGGQCVSVREVAHRARNALALLAALFAALLPLEPGFADAAPTQIHSGSAHASFVAPAAVFGDRAVVRLNAYAGAF